MEKIIDYFKIWGGLFFTIVAVFGFLNFFGVLQINTDKFRGGLMIILLLLISIATFFIYFIRTKNNVTHHIPKQKFEQRRGYQQSKTEEYGDYIHKYDLVHRRDYLNFKTGNYFSVRHLVGFNASSKDSDGLIYYEGMDIKTKYKNVVIVANDQNNDCQLGVENISGDEHSKFFLAFKIKFVSPLKPGEKFDILFSIYIPNEVQALGTEDEFMSISLKRCMKGVAELKFDIVLNFIPVHRCVIKDNIFKKVVFCKELCLAPKPNEFNIDGDEFHSLSLWWFEKEAKKPKCSMLNFFLLSSNCKNPKRTVYAIHFTNK
jgi:hypothetical protein